MHRSNNLTQQEFFLPVVVEVCLVLNQQAMVLLVPGPIVTTGMHLFAQHSDPLLVLGMEKKFWSEFFLVGNKFRVGKNLFTIMSQPIKVDFF